MSKKTKQQLLTLFLRTVFLLIVVYVLVDLFGLIKEQEKESILYPSPEAAYAASAMNGEKIIFLIKNNDVALFYGTQKKAPYLISTSPDGSNWTYPEPVTSTYLRDYLLCINKEFCHLTKIVRYDKAFFILSIFEGDGYPPIEDNINGALMYRQDKNIDLRYYYSTVDVSVGTYTLRIGDYERSFDLS